MALPERCLRRAWTCISTVLRQRDFLTSFSSKREVLRLLPPGFYKSFHHNIERPKKKKDQPVNELYEDPELNVVPEREEYADLWLHIKGYDFVTVESYLKFVHRFINCMKIPVEQVAMPPRLWSISTYKVNSEIENNRYELKMSHRVLKLSGVPNNTLSLLVDMVTRHIPSGVELSLTEPNEQLTEFRYVPDGDVKALQEAMYDLENPRLKKKKGY